MMALQRLIRFLEQAQQSPYVYLGTMHPEAVTMILQAMANTCTMFDVPWDRDIYKQVVEAHGWTYTAKGALPSLQATSMTDEEITHELLALEIAMWTLIAERLRNST